MPVMDTTSGIHRRFISVLAAIVVEIAVLVAVGQAAWSAQTDTTRPAGDETSHDTFWEKFKDMGLGPLTFSFSGQARLRFEDYDGLTLKGFEPGGHDQLLLERVRLDLATRLWDKPYLFLQLQDAHPFLTKFRDSDFPKSSPIENTLDVRQLYLEWLRIGDSPLGFRLGRQQISYGDQRVFGPGSWGNTGRFAWDAAMLKVDADWFWMDAWIGRFLQYKTAIWPDRSVNDFSTFVVYAGIKNLPMRIDLFYVNKVDKRDPAAGGESATGYLSTSSVGIQAEGTVAGVLAAGGTFVGQFGRYGGEKIRAFGTNMKLGLTLPVGWKPQIGAQFTYGSGDQDPSDGIHGTFDGVYGGRDIFFYGYLNLFFWANLRDAELDLSMRPGQNVSAYLEYHHFVLAEARDAWYTTSLAPYRRDPTGRSGTDLGDELDFRMSWMLWNHLEVMAGVGRFFPGAFVAHTGPAKEPNWYCWQLAYAW